MIYRLLADLILLIHLSIVLFVIVAQFFIVIGLILKWPSIKNIYFRLTHLIAIAIVAAQAIVGQTCPLTTWENKFRILGNEAPYPDRFFPYWIHQILFFDWSPQVFTFLYCGFGVIVLLTFVLAPPRLGRRPCNKDST